MAMRERREGGRTIEEVVWTPEELDIVEKPNGPAVAALLASGVGSLVLGIMTTWAEASVSFKEKLQYQDRVGPLSGKTTIAGIAFLVAWAVLAPILWRRNIPWLPALVATGVLLTAAAVGTYPEFFQQFADE